MKVAYISSKDENVEKLLNARLKDLDYIIETRLHVIFKL